MLKVGAQFARYVIEEQIGAGSMGEVYRAQQKTLNRQVALKVMRRELAADESYRVRFSNEAASLARLDSPYVTQIFDFGEFRKSLFLATQFVRGGDLSRLVASEGGLGVNRTLEIGACILTGLGHAHDVGVLHRDIKPSNVLLRSSDEDHAYLCDFGIARDLEADATLNATLMGTFGYLAPERFDGAPATVQSDVYAAGCVLYAIASGRDPYLGTSTNVMLKHIQHPIPVLGGSRPGTPELNDIIQRAMAKDPALRYPSAAEMAQHLKAASGRLAKQSDYVHVEKTVLRSELAPAPVTSTSVGEPVVYTAATLAQSIPAPVTDTAHSTKATRPITQVAPSPKSDRTKILLAAVTGALAVALLGGAFWLGTAQQDEPNQVVAESKSDSPSGSTPSEANPPTETAESDSPMVDCWDGSSMASENECPLPTGKQGMAWVFPTFLPGQKCSSDGPGGGKLEEWECYEKSSQGRVVLVRYSQWDNLDKGHAHYDAKRAGASRTTISEQGTPTRYVWNYDGTNSQGQYVVASMYLDYPYSVSIYAFSPGEAQSALNSVVEFRSADSIKSPS